MKVHLKYYSFFSQWRGLSEETLEVPYPTAQELYSFQKDLFQYGFPQEKIRLAINDEFCNWDTPLKEGDKIVFIAPVSGG